VNRPPEFTHQLGLELSVIAPASSIVPLESNESLNDCPEGVAVGRGVAVAVGLTVGFGVAVGGDCGVGVSLWRAADNGGSSKWTKVTSKSVTTKVVPLCIPNLLSRSATASAPQRV
jgi:hypothetical protein